MDKEKVIEGLEMSYTYSNVDEDNTLVPQQLVLDALALLKAQEPVEPILDIRHGKSMWRCGSCSTAFQPNQIYTKFCFNCGRAVKWDG